MIKKYFLRLLALVLTMLARAQSVPLKLMVFGDSLSVGHQLPREASFYFHLPFI